MTLVLLLAVVPLVPVVAWHLYAWRHSAAERRRRRLLLSRSMRRNLWHRSWNEWRR